MVSRRETPRRRRSERAAFCGGVCREGTCNPAAARPCDEAWRISKMAGGCARSMGRDQSDLRIGLIFAKRALKRAELVAAERAVWPSLIGHRAVG